MGVHRDHPRTLQLCRTNVMFTSERPWPLGGHRLGLRHGTPACPEGRRLTTGTCSCPGLRHRVTKLHYSNEKFTQEKERSPASPPPLSLGPKIKELNESNQLINQYYQHSWERGTRRLGDKFHVSTKGKPFSLKKKKEQTRVVCGPTTGRNLGTRPASPRLKRHLASQPKAQFSQGGCSRNLWENGQPETGARTGPPTRSANSSLGHLARGPLSSSQAGNSSQPHLPRSSKGAGGRSRSVL